MKAYQPSLNKRHSEDIDPDLVHATVKLNTVLFAVVCGTLGGVFLFTITFLSLYRGLPNPGHYLNLLGVFLPGYEVSLLGAWIGLFWGAIWGGVLGILIYRVYARNIWEMTKAIMKSDKTEKELENITISINGNYLGLAMGSAVGLGLFITSMWLVIRGTAAESMHASLLTNYLPGYSVSVVGAIIGAIEMFIVVYILCLILSWIYNMIATDSVGELK